MLDRQLKGQGDVFAVCLCAAERRTAFILYMQLTQLTMYQTIRSIRTVFANKIVIYLHMHTIYTELLYLCDIFFFKQ